MKNFNSLLTVKRNSDPFGMGGGALNIFDQANQRQRQQNSPMPNGMEQNIPRNATAVPNSQQRQQQQQNYQQQQFNQTGMTGGQDDPNDSIINGNDNGGSNGGGSLMDKYRQEPDNGNQQQQEAQQQQQQQQPQNGVQDYFSLGADHFTNAFNQRDFTRGIDEDTFQKVLDGDANSLREVLNSVARNAASTSSYLSQQVSKRGTEGLLDGFKKDLPKQIRDQNINESWNNNKHSLMNDRAVAPISQAVLEMVRNRNPNATAQEINSEAERYFKELYGVMGTSMASSDESESSNGQRRSSGDGLDMSQLFDE